MLMLGPGPRNATNSLLSTFVKGTESVNNSKELKEIPSSGRQHVAFNSCVFLLIVNNYRWKILIPHNPSHGKANPGSLRRTTVGQKTGEWRQAYFPHHQLPPPSSAPIKY